MIGLFKRGEAALLNIEAGTRGTLDPGSSSGRQELQKAALLRPHLRKGFRFQNGIGEKSRAAGSQGRRERDRRERAHRFQALVPSGGLLRHRLEEWRSAFATAPSVPAVDDNASIEEGLFSKKMCEPLTQAH